MNTKFSGEREWRPHVQSWRKWFQFLFLSLNLLFGWHFSIWNCCKPFLHCFITVISCIWFKIIIGNTSMDRDLFLLLFLRFWLTTFLVIHLWRRYIIVLVTSLLTQTQILHPWRKTTDPFEALMKVQKNNWVKTRKATVLQYLAVKASELLLLIFCWLHLSIILVINQLDAPKLVLQ